LPARFFGQASVNAIDLDMSAAGWGWFVDKTPHNDSEFVRPGNQGGQNRMDLLTVREHEVGHLLGFERANTVVMIDTLPTGTRRVPSSGSDSVDVAVLDWIFGDGQTSLFARRYRELGPPESGDDAEEGRRKK
jgi:hypothetical protein